MDVLIPIALIVLVAGGIFYYKKQKEKGRDIFNRPIGNRREK